MKHRTGVVLLAIIGVAALLAPRFLPAPNAQPDALHLALLAPGVGHWLGTDQLSRDVLARVVAGARVSLAVALLAVAVSMSLGAGAGLVAGYVGGAVDAVLMRLVDGALAIPR
ncbi:MAG: ABC transporter permease, partial [Gemmatimonadales bacterium]